MFVLLVVIMVRKRRTEQPSAGESSEPQVASAGRGTVAQRPPPQQQQPQQPQPQPQGGYQGRGRGGQGAQGGQPQGGRGWGPRGGGSTVGGPQRGGMTPQQYPTGPVQQSPRGTAPFQGGGGDVHGGSGSGPSKAPTPELHQATQVPQQAESSVGSSSNQPVDEAAAQLKQLSVQQQQQQEVAVQAAPASSKSMRFPLRPGKGSSGTRCIVKANHFFLNCLIRIYTNMTYRGVNRAVMAQLVKLYKDSHLGKRLPAYDGRKSLYTAGPLPFISKDFKITLLDEDDGSGSARRERDFKVAIKLASRADLHHLDMFLQGRQADAPQEALQVLDIVLRELPTNR